MSSPVCTNFGWQITACTPLRSWRSYQPSRASGGTSVVSTATRIPSFRRICSSLRVTSRFCVYYRIDLAPATTRQLCFHFLYQAALLRVDMVLIQIWRLRNQESFSPLRFWVVFPTVQISQAKRSVWIKQQGVQRHTHHRLVSAMFLQRLFHVLFKLFVGFLQRRVHLHADDLLPVGRQRLRNIFERNERSQAHQ